MGSHLPLKQHGFSKSAHPTPGAYLEWGVQGCGKRILVYLIIVPRNIIICKLDYFIIYFFNILPTQSPPKQLICIPPCSLMVAPPLYLTKSLQLFFGWLLCVSLAIGNHIRPTDNIFIYIFVIPIVSPNNGTTPSHTI